jgi:hypothetical protein
MPKPKKVGQFPPVCTLGSPEVLLTMSHHTIIPIMNRFASALFPRFCIRRRESNFFFLLKIYILSYYLSSVMHIVDYLSRDFITHITTI